MGTVKRISNTSEIGSILRARREAQGITVTDLASTVGAQRSTLLRIEQGTTSPTWGMVLALSQALDLQPVLVPRQKMPAVEAVIRMSDSPETPPLAGDGWD